VHPVSITKSAKLHDHFAELTDPRLRKVTYPLINVVVIAVCAVICGADDFVAIAEFGEKKRKWFARFLDLHNGIPSHDRFNAILAAIKPAEFEKCFLSWITTLQEITDGQVIAIDGKTLRRSFDTASGKTAIHMVSAWATVNQISLGQVVVDAKSNEITAIPKLLQMLEISGCLVTIDAMGCQTEIAKQIIAGGADYVLTPKGNQPTLQQGITKFFDDHLEDDFARTKVHRYETEEKGHGREETRYYSICPVPDDLPDRSRWAGLKAIGIAISETQRNGKICNEVRYYILSKYLSGRRFAEAVRGHWGIENRLHWQLDVTFQEDQCRIRKGNADTNFSTLRRTALSMLKSESSLKVGVKNKRLAAGWDETYLEKVLLGQ
jgi:predicted transposase YbfD/YdcC